MSNFIKDIVAVREEAQQHLAEGAMTSKHGIDAAKVVDVLNDALATEIVCWLRYQQHATVAAGIHRRAVSAEFAEHAAEELNHALAIAERIMQLGGTPSFDPTSLESRAETSFRVYADTDLVGMLRENLIAERIVIQVYLEIIRWLDDSDPTTRRLIEQILQEEEEHAGDLHDLLGGFVGDDGSRRGSAESRP